MAEPEADASAGGLGSLGFIDPHLHGSGLTRFHATVPAVAPRPLPPAGSTDPADFGDGFRLAGAGTTWTLPAALDRTHTTSLLVWASGRLVLEWYAEGVSPGSLLLGASMTKSALSGLVGAAVHRGRLSLDDLVVDHVPELAGSGYAHCSVGDVAGMVSGVAWREDYRSPDSPAQQLLRTFAAGAGGSRDLLTRIGPEDPPGTRYAYCTADSQVLDWVRERADGTTYAEAMADWWRLLGCEADAIVGLDGPPEAGGVGLAGGALVACARDWLRIGLVHLDGTVAGERVLDETWLRAALSAAYPFTRVGRLPSTLTTHAGFGLHWWPVDDSGLRAMADGSRGQLTLVDRERDVVIVKTSQWPYDEGTDRQCRDLSYLLLPQLAAHLTRS